MATQKASSAVSTRPRRLHGRDSELARVITMVAEEQRVTLMGLPGTGKTALLHAAIRSLRGQFEVVWLVPGAQPETASRSLLVADLSEDDADEVAALTAAVDRHKGPVLCASSAALGVTAEQVVTVPSLGAPTTVDSLEDHPAVALWLERVRDALGDGYTTTPSERRALMSLLQQVDGLPAAVVTSAELFSALTLTEQVEHLGTDDDPLGKRLSKLFDRNWNALADHQRDVLLSALVMGGTSAAEVRAEIGGGASETVLALQQRGLLRRGATGRLQVSPTCRAVATPPRRSRNPGPHVRGLRAEFARPARARAHSNGCSRGRSRCSRRSVE